ncbi:MAG: 3-hydroxyacyl-CoA dehydrogenase NAD-binding domain-containing protein [Gemmatimonadales bacterium]
MSHIAVIGSGTMGNGIAHVFAQHGHEVALIDVNAAALERAKATIAGNLDRHGQEGDARGGGDGRDPRADQHRHRPRARGDGRRW